MNARARSHIVTCLSLLLLIHLGASWATLSAAPGWRKKDKAPRKGSEAVRQNPFLRDYFRERALSMQPSLQDNTRSLNSTVDFLLDDFVERSLKLTQKLSTDTDELYRLAPRYRTLASPSDAGGQAEDRGLFEKTRVTVETIKSTTKSLEGQMEFMVQALHLTIKVSEPGASAADAAQLCDDVENLHTTVEKFQKDLNEFLFPKSNTVSLEGLQTAALPIQLKKIERYAERIEVLTRRLK